MILEQLGMLAENSALTTASTAKASYTLDLASVYNYLGYGPLLWLAIKTTVVASYGNADETYQFILRKGTGTNGTDINAGNVDIIETPAISYTEATAAAGRLRAGAWILRCSVPYEADLRYLQVWKTFAGTSPTISVDISISPSAPPSERNIAVHASPVGVP